MDSFRICLLALYLAPQLFADPPKPALEPRVLRDVSYVTDGHERQKLDLYLPAKPAGPVIVYIHGGAWRSGSKDKPLGLELLAKGYTVASIAYRFSQDAIFPAQIQDCKSAIRWIRAHADEFGYDPRRIGVIGQSAGGHLVALLAVTGTSRDFDAGEHLDQSSAVQCGVDFFGPTDFPGWKPPSAIPLIQRSGSDSCLEQLFGGPLDDKLELAKSASPVSWVSKDAAPLFIIHGTKDPLVGLEQSQVFAEKLTAAGAEATLTVVENGGHGGPGFLSGDVKQRMVEFLNRHITEGE